MEPLKVIGKIFRAAREGRDLSQEDFAELLGVTQTHVSRVEGGKSPPGPEMLDAFRKVTRDEAAFRQIRVALRAFRGFDDLAPPVASEPVATYEAGRFPIAGRSALGRFVEALENSGRPPSEKKLTEPWRDAAELGSSKAFAVVADGDSMYPTIQDGDEVLVDPGAELLANAKPRPQIAFVWLDGKSTIKRYRRVGDVIILSADNPDRSKYPDREVTAEEWESGAGIAWRVILSRSNRRH